MRTAISLEEGGRQAGRAGERVEMMPPLSEDKASAWAVLGESQPSPAS